MARAVEGRKSHLEDSRCGVPTGVEKSDDELALCCREKVLDLLCSDFRTFVKFDSVKVSDSAGEIESLSLSEPSRDFVGEGGRGTVVGVRFSQFMVSENFVGDAGGVKL